jgi:hypothetical protein
LIFQAAFMVVAYFTASKVTFSITEAPVLSEKPVEEPVFNLPAAFFLQNIKT